MTVTVRFEGDEDEVTFLLASRVEPDMPIDVYSPRSPLGSAILGKREGDSATYALPNGRSLTVEILNVVPYPGLQSSEAEQSGTIGSSGRRLPGLLIAFEGGEGVGKSTQARLLAIWLRDRGYDVVSTHEPGATKVGMRLRALLLDTANTGLSPLAEALMYAADRAQHVASVIEPALDRDAIVITDRYIDSSLAYQGAGRNLPVEEIATFNRQATGGLFPDLTILLDMDPIAAQQRRSPSADRLEAEPAEFHKRVRTGFLALAREEPSRYLVLDADRPPDEITRDIQRRMHGMLLDPDQLHVTQRRARSAAPPQ